MTPKKLNILLTILLFAACTEPAATPATKLPYSTTSDSAYHYFQVGWRQIMDEGRYGQAEVSYRKALSFDPDFLIGKATLGRLTLDTTERRRIEQELEGVGKQLPKIERDLLELYTNFVRFTNLRDHSPAAAREMLIGILPTGQTALGHAVHQYVDEPYLKSEYVELINSNQGPEAALDSFRVLTNTRHADNPFLLGFAATLEAETGNFEEALRLASELESVMTDPLAPKVPAIYADIYLAMDSLERAHDFALKATELDPRNLDASRLLTRIEARLQKWLRTSGSE
ncbi:MAG: hypothetical protein AAF597_01210 [Bacteroidota bacterium]